MKQIKYAPFTLPCQPTKALYPVGEVIGEMSTDPEFVKGLEDGRQWLREVKAQVPEGVNAELIVEILSDYASLQQDGVIDSAGRYSPADAMEQADLLLTASSAKASHWSANNPGRADQYMGEALAARRALGFSEDAEDVAPIDITNAIVELRQPTTELAPESWREELETIAEILEADGDEWNCAARIRKMLTASPAPAHIPGAGEMIDDHIGDGNELVSALRQYRHNDDSGFVFAYDKEQTDRIVTGLVEALEQIAESCDVGRYDGKPEDGPMRTDMEMWLIAQEALNTYLQQEETER